MTILVGAALSGAAFSTFTFRRANEADRRADTAERGASRLVVDLDKARMELELMSFALGASNRERDALRVQLGGAGDAPTPTRTVATAATQTAEESVQASSQVMAILRCVPDHPERVLTDSRTIAALAGGIIARASACATAGVASAHITPVAAAPR